MQHRCDCYPSCNHKSTVAGNHLDNEWTGVPCHREAQHIWTPVADETAESRPDGAEVSERDRSDVTEGTDSLEVNSGENRLRKFGPRIWQDNYRRDICRWIREASSSDDPEAALGALIRDFATVQEFAGEMFAWLTIPTEGIDSLQKGGNA
jgi:hypothetical protein